MLFGKLLNQFPSSVIATVIKHIDVITPMQCRYESLLQNIRLVFNKAQRVNFHVAVSAGSHIRRSGAIRGSAHLPKFAGLSLPELEFIETLYRMTGSGGATSLPMSSGATLAS
jgi:hypothetical protein